MIASERSGPLAGITVLELATLVAGPMAGSVLGGLGADVIKLERPGGEPGRWMGPPTAEGADERTGFVVANFAKRSVVVDLRRPEGVDVLRRLLRSVDIVLDNYRPSAWARLGLSPRDEVADNSRLVWVSLSGFGVGPDRERPGVDLIVQAESGMMATTGEPGGPPVRIGFLAVDAATSYVIATSALAGIVGRDRAGADDRFVDLSLMQVALHLQTHSFASFLATGDAPERLGRAAALTAPADAYPASDGWVVFSAQQPKEWERLCGVLGADELVDDPRFVDVHARIAHRDELADVIAALLRKDSTARWIHRLRDAGVVVGRLASYEDVLAMNDRQGDRSPWLAVTTSDGGFAEVVRPPVGRHTGQLRVPLLGEHTAEVLATAGFTKNEVVALVASGVVSAADPTTGGSHE